MKNKTTFFNLSALYLATNLENDNSASECHLKAAVLADYLISNNINIAFAESVTGGLLMSQLVNTPGISSVLKGGVVCYQAESKQSILNVSKELIRKHTCESTRISTAIAESIMKLADSQVAVGVTGLASKGASQSIHKPIGSIFLTVIYHGVIYQTTTLLKGNREQIRNQAAIFCFDQILAILKSDNFEKSNAVLKKSITSRGRRIIDYRVD